jgi:phospholipid/cholesterol/gamma-HCH transport system substrate-binding protein
MTSRSQYRWAEVRVGLFVLVAIGLLVAAIMSLNRGMGFFSTQTEYRAVVAHTQNLKVGGPVRMNGVDIGNVRAIGLAKDAPRVIVTFTVTSSVASHIRKDASVRIRSMGLLGDKFLEILPGTPAMPPMAPGGQLTGEADMDLNLLAAGATDTMAHVNSAIREIQRLLVSLHKGQGTATKLLTDPTLYDSSKRVMDKLEVASDKSIRLLDRVERGEGTVGKLVTDREIYDRANKAVQELTQLVQRLNKDESTLAKLSNPDLYEQLDSLTTRGDALVTRLERGEGTIGKLVTDDELYARMDKLLTDMEDLVADVKENPTKYFSFSVF